MPKQRDLSGQRFGGLTVLEKTDKREDRYIVWKCRCDCGNVLEVNSKRLMRGTVRSCGCIPAKTARRGNQAEDLTGRTFGELKVLRRAESAGRRVRWVCSCSCGNLTEVTAQSLKAGKVKSCGCRKYIRESARTDLRGLRFGRLTVLEPANKIDYRGSAMWKCQCDCGQMTVVSEDNLVRGNYRSCGCLKKEIQKDIVNRLHHLDGTCVEWLEKRKHRSDNTSGFRGVYQNRQGRYRVIIGFKRKRYTVGTYHTFEEAKAARLEAEKLIHEGFVQAYYRWKEMAEENPEWGKENPLVFEVEKKNGEFSVITNVKDT